LKVYSEGPEPASLLPAPPVQPGVSQDAHAREESVLKHPINRGTTPPAPRQALNLRLLQTPTTLETPVSPRTPKPSHTHKTFGMQTRERSGQNRVIYCSCLICADY